MSITRTVLKPAGLAMLGLSLALTATGCRERVCAEGEYPLVDNTGAGACVTAGEEAPSGWQEYPAGEALTSMDEIYPDYP